MELGKTTLLFCPKMSSKTNLVVEVWVGKPVGTRQLLFFPNGVCRREERFEKFDDLNFYLVAGKSGTLYLFLWYCIIDWLTMIKTHLLSLSGVIPNWIQYAARPPRPTTDSTPASTSTPSEPRTTAQTTALDLARAPPSASSRS